MMARFLFRFACFSLDNCEVSRSGQVAVVAVEPRIDDQADADRGRLSDLGRAVEAVLEVCMLFRVYNGAANALL